MPGLYFEKGRMEKEMLYIKKANDTDLQEEWLFVKEMPEDENGMTNAWHGISLEAFKDQALPDMIRYEKGIGLPEGMVPETFLFLWLDDCIIGQFRIRHYLNEALRKGAGHIGYCIANKYRGKGYATEGLKLTLQIAKEIVKEEEIYLRVNKNNPASLRVMMKNGGIIVDENEEKFFVRIRKGSISWE